MIRFGQQDDIIHIQNMHQSASTIMQHQHDYRQPGGRKGVEVALDLGDAMLQRQQPLPQKPLKHRPHTRPVDAKAYS